MSKIKIMKTLVYTVVFLSGVTESKDGSDRLALLCGGTIESDEGRLDFQGNSQEFVAGTMCVWTLHLTSFRDFFFNFTHFDVKSKQGDCSDAGVRIYAVTNLAILEQSPSFVFCSGNPPPDNFTLGYNVAIVTFYVSPVSNVNHGTGFVLQWQGRATDPLRTRHILSYSSSYEGTFQYPVIGNYPTNIIATWLYKLQSRSDLVISSIQLEKSCPFPNQPCSCDAVIIYEAIYPGGRLVENRRLCGKKEKATLPNLEPRFVIAFFSDREMIGGGAAGLQGIYFPTNQTVSSTTTTGYWTTPTTTYYTTPYYTSYTPYYTSYKTMIQPK